MKLAIGSAQFGLDYGINNQRGKVSKKETINILNYAKEVGINTIDTAQAYGTAEQIIGNIIFDNSFKIISKISIKENDDVNKLITKSLNNLKVNKLYGLLFHNFKDFIANPNLLEELLEKKEEGKIEKIGFSLYYPKELDFLLDNNFVFDLVQVPYSIFDRRFEHYFEILKDKKVEIHIRSVFLQGLVFMKTDSLSEHFKSIFPKLNLLRNLANENEISITSIALNFAVNEKLIDKVVLGIDSLEQLKNNVNILNEREKINSISNEIDKININNENILLPYNWK